MKFLISNIFLLVLTQSCSTTVQNELESKTYSKNTEQKFRDIENGQARKPELNKFHKEANLPKSYSRVNNQFTIESSKEGSDDRIIELNQNLAYYCMKGSRRARFKTENDCLQFVENSLDKCEKNHRTVNRSLINCVKSNLMMK